jgi:hypothetical protein
MSGEKPKEFARLGLLAAVAAWLLHPFATSRMYGAGDALWYANMLADYVTQLRAGIFPIFAGQTEFAFNGAVYPLRVAPLYQHLAGLLDLLTGRTLGFIALQHLTVIVCGVAGIYASYLTLCRIAPGRRWSAAGFSILYLSCPGILATIYTQDLYMTWMTVPLAPLAVYGIVRTFRKDDLASQFWLAAPLAALWWAHSPIALWFTFIAAASQFVRLAYVRDSLDPFKRAILGIVVFAVLAQYPFVSVAEIHTPGVASAAVGSLDHPEKIVGFVGSVFPGALLPLSSHAKDLSDVQLGYALWAVLIAAAIAAFAGRPAVLPVLLASAAVLLLLLLPIPGLNRFLWGRIPAEVVRITYYWPMQRFYLILAALLAAAGQIAIGSTVRLRRSHIAFACTLALGCLWSLWESRQFIRGSGDRTGTAESSSKLQRPENLMLMNHAYGLFPKLPAYFSNGVVDPRSQFRLKSALTGRLLPPPEENTIQSGSLVGTVDANPGILDLDPALHLEPARRYDLKIDFARENAPGILQFVGRSMFREYNLPSSGEAMAFGDGPNSSHNIDLWTSEPSGDDVKIRFIPSTTGVTASEFRQFASFKLTEINPAQEPVEVVSLIPLKANVRAIADAFLETPRVYIPGYRAEVDGHKSDIVRSQEGLVEIPVPIGSHAILLRFDGPVTLSLSYWTSICGWALTLLMGIRAILRPIKN